MQGDTQLAKCFDMTGIVLQVTLQLPVSGEGDSGVGRTDVEYSLEDLYCCNGIAAAQVQIAECT